jgi:hypothetical protein
VAALLGVALDSTALSDVYSDPSHILVDPDGNIHQQLALCFHAVTVDAADEQPRPDEIETDAAAWRDPAGITELTMHPAMRLRLHNAVAAPHTTHYE